MRSIIEELHYGQFSLSEQDIIRGGDIFTLTELVERNEDGLVSRKR